METDRMKQLLEKFYDGLTTEQEELTLKEFFQGDDMPDSLLHEKELFLQLTANRTTVPPNLEEHLSRKIDEWERASQPRTFQLRWIGGIAASVVILLTIGSLLPIWNPTPKDTCASVEEAYLVAQKALILFSNSVNKGLDEVEDAGEKTTKTMQHVDKQLRLLDKQLQRVNE